jgi:hypothetical protein
MMELKADKVFQKLAGLTRFPSQSTISRFLSRITVHKAQHVAEINFRLLRRIRKGFRELKAITLDLDSHVIPVFGRQHRARRGYNPKKRGRSSYHPLMWRPGIIPEACSDLATVPVSIRQRIS